jgi:uncharacterized membrane protein required for colicin V production
MIFNNVMTIWILAILIITSVALVGWRQGAIRAAFSFVGILFATLLAVPVGKLVHPLLPHLGASNPIIAWALAPVIGFILVSIVFKVAARQVHNRVEHYYKYKAGDLRLALWERVNSRLGICIGVLNGTIYFILVSFLIFNLTYWTTQVSSAQKQSAFTRLVNQLGTDMQSSKFSPVACGVGTVRPSFYQFADLAGFLMQNPQTGRRLADYPALTSLWEQDVMKPLVTDAALTNALNSGATPGEILKDENVRAFLANQEQTKIVTSILQTNLTDLMTYLETGKSAKYDGEKIIGHWEFNPAVTLAWLRQSKPKMPASEMRSVRAWVTQAYAKTRVLVTGDNQLFLKGLPRVKNDPGQSASVDTNDWKGDWTANGNNYDLHVALGGEDKFMTATAEELRLTIKDGQNLLIFDRAF